MLQPNRADGNAPEDQHGGRLGQRQALVKLFKKAETRGERARAKDGVTTFRGPPRESIWGETGLGYGWRLDHKARKEKGNKRGLLKGLHSLSPSPKQRPKDEGGI